MRKPEAVLGLDIGPSSLGWALIENGPGEGRIIDAGVHLFEAGVDGGQADAETALTRGREQSKAKPRRDARAMRRQTWRRARRKKKLLGALIRHGLLPEGDIRTPGAIDAYVKSLDERLKAKWVASASHTDKQRWLYRLRAAGATSELDRLELGRAIYHLAQRRGFLSNRRTEAKDGEESEIKSQIATLATVVEAHDPPTLGAYLASIDPDQERIRCRWTSRAMYTREFDAIWNAQAQRLGVNGEAREEIEHAIFHQRPLKDQRHLIGRCSLTGESRAPVALRIAQRFRVLQQVNHLRVVHDDLSERALTADERSALTDALCREGDLTVAKARQAAGIGRSAKFSIERGGEKKLIGHRTDATLRDVFGDRWDELSDDEKDEVVHDVRSIREPDALRRRARRHWRLDAEQADALADVVLEEGHSKHGRSALERLVALMSDGLTYSEARQQAYPDSFTGGKAHDELPPLEDFDADLTNPAVARAMTEMRKVVNAVVRRHGKPDRVHLELARDLKQGRAKRMKLTKRMRDREREREQAAQRILKELPGFRGEPKRSAIEKVLLAEECGWICPFTGRSFGMADLVGPEPQVDIEHIWPMSRSLDNSFLNKTLCFHEENRHRKRGKTPREAYGGDPERFEAILQRVRTFRGDRFAVREKLRRFEAEGIDADFTNRHLSDTRYINAIAADYVALLYGGRGVPGQPNRVLTPTGPAIAWQRRGWGLDQVLSERDEKERSDHRHHAIDAIVVALTDQGAIKRLADAAERREREGDFRPIGALPEPWRGFREQVGKAIDDVVVSHRQSRKVRGALHKETLYSKPAPNGKRRVRKELWKLSKTEVQREQVVDKRALAEIREKLDELGEKDPAKAFAEPGNLPLVRGGNDRSVPLKKVRVEVGANPRQFGKGPKRRWANPAANHHAAFYDKPLPGGGVDRIVEVVSLADAHERARRGEPIVDREPRGEHRFVFSIAPNEFLQFDDGVDHPTLCRVLSLSGPSVDIEVVGHTDGRTATDRKAAKERIRLRSGGVRRANFRKVTVSYLGEVRDAGG